MFTSLKRSDDDDEISLPPPPAQSSASLSDTPSPHVAGLLSSSSSSKYSADTIISVAAAKRVLPQFTGDLEDFREIDTGRGKSRVRVLRSDDGSPHLICSDRSGAGNRKLHRYDAEGRHIVEYVEHSAGDVIGLAILDDFVVSGCDRGIVHVWDHRSGKQMVDLPNPHSSSKDIWCDRLTDTVLVAGNPKEIREYSLYNNQMISELDLDNESTVKSVRTTEDHVIIACDLGGKVAFWDRAEERIVRLFKTQEARQATALALAGTSLFVGCGAGWVQHYDFRKEGMLNSWCPHPSDSCWVWEIDIIDASLGWFVSVSDHDHAVAKWRSDGKIVKSMNTGASNWGVCVWNPGCGIDQKLVAESLEERIGFMLNSELLLEFFCWLVSMGATGSIHLVCSLGMLRPSVGGE